MTITADDWLALEEQPGATGTVLRRIHPDSDRDLYVAVDLGTRVRRLIYRRPWPGGTSQLPTLPRTQALDSACRLSDTGDSLTISVDLHVPALADVFTTVAGDLAASVVDAQSDDQAVKALASRLESWQELFRALSRRGLGDLERRGLFAELMILRDDILPHVPPAAAIAAWTGPLRKNQDFQLPGVALEVKATAGLNPLGFVVSNERELDEQGAGRLHLVHVSLDERRGGDGVTLNDLVADVEALLSTHPAAPQVFLTRLARAGYVKGDKGLYSEPRYRMRSRRYYDIQGSFPRITERDLREGVGQVRYTVTLAACAPYEVDRAVVHRRIKDWEVQ
ncbi:PD-(D/E)XK motif protein [Blastococcus sp. SYSU DS0669]